ncbi:MAG: hypothetical protein HC828_22130 [Blastochloris sp.]|nr:hypothetical protein [Blastochloris sp.]
MAGKLRVEFAAGIEQAEHFEGVDGGIEPAWRGAFRNGGLVDHFETGEELLDGGFDFFLADAVGNCAGQPDLTIAEVARQKKVCCGAAIWACFSTTPVGGPASRNFRTSA